MNWKWFKIFSMIEFVGTGLVYKDYQVELEGLGVYTIRALQGQRQNILFDSVFLTVNLNAKNPFTFEGRGVFVDENQDVWVGVQDAD